MRDNPMREARTALEQHPQCGARSKRTGFPCKAPSMPNGRCRLHGGKSPGAPSGEKHWNYRHGRRSKAAAQNKREVRELLRALRALNA